MANIIIRREERRVREDRVARRFGYDPKRMSTETREQMECIAAKDREIFKPKGDSKNV